jgi:hypothetical protein
MSPGRQWRLARGIASVSGRAFSGQKGTAKRMGHCDYANFYRQIKELRRSDADPTDPEQTHRPRTDKIENRPPSAYALFVGCLSQGLLIVAVRLTR